MSVKDSIKKSKEKTNDCFLALGIGCFVVAITIGAVVPEGQAILPGIEPFSISPMKQFLTYVSLGTVGMLSTIRGLKDTHVKDDEINRFMKDKKRMDKYLNKLRKQEDEINSKAKFNL